MRDRITISEIYGPVIQGEGAVIGKPTVFVRTGGCDYRCSWCDSPYAVLPEFRGEWRKMRRRRNIRRYPGAFRRTDTRDALGRKSGATAARKAHRPRPLGRLHVRHRDSGNSLSGLVREARLPHALPEATELRDADGLGETGAMPRRGRSAYGIDFQGSSFRRRRL